MKTVTLYTDGACSGNPGPGGWGAILKYGAHEKELSGGEPSTTNNRMELMAAITGLEKLTRPCEVQLYSDSKYLTDAFNQHWTASISPTPSTSAGCAAGSRRAGGARRAN